LLHNISVCCISIGSFRSDGSDILSNSTPVRIIVEYASVYVGVVADKFRTEYLFDVPILCSDFLHARRLIYYQAMVGTGGCQ
jgi:hypothetical protein